MKIRAVLFAATVGFSYVVLAAPVVEDRDIGTVRSFTRTVTVDLDACKSDFRIFTMPLPSSIPAHGECVVLVPTREQVPATAQTVAHIEARETEGQVEVRRLTLHGDGLSYKLRLYDRDGIANWAAAEKRFRQFLDEKVNGGRYETIVTKVVLTR